MFAAAATHLPVETQNLHAPDKYKQLAQEVFVTHCTLLLFATAVVVVVHAAIVEIGVGNGVGNGVGFGVGFGVGGIGVGRGVKPHNP